MEIINKALTFDIYGFSGIAAGKEYAATAFKLMDKMWKTVKSNNLKNKGLNIWVYEPGERVFAGVELYDPPNPALELEQNVVVLKTYAYHKHVGPYNLIKAAGQAMTNELKNKGLETKFPYVEVYGHWTNDETKLETELYMALK